MAKQRTKIRRPGVVTFVGMILFLTALFNLLFGVVLSFDVALNEPLTFDSLIAPEDSPELFTELGEEAVTAVSLLFTGFALLLIGVGFWQMQRWAWVAAISWQAFNLLLGLASGFFLDTTALPLLFSIVLVFLLNMIEVRRAFGIRSNEHDSNSITSLSTPDRN